MPTFIDAPSPEQQRQTRFNQAVHEVHRLLAIIDTTRDERDRGLLQAEVDRICKANPGVWQYVSDGN